jgi:hypothetical protein
MVWYSPHTGCRRDTQLSLLQMGTAGDASEQNWLIIQADLEDLSSCAQLSTTLRTRTDYTHCITNS